MKPKKFPSLSKLVETAAQMGHNPQEAKSIISEKYEYIKRKHPDVSPKRAVHIAYLIY